MAQDIKAREAEDEIAVGLRPIYDRLSEMKAQLDQLCKLQTVHHGGKADEYSIDTSMDVEGNGSVQVRISVLCKDVWSRLAKADPTAIRCHYARLTRCGWMGNLLMRTVTRPRGNM